MRLCTLSFLSRRRSGNDDDGSEESASLKDPLLPLVQDKYAKLSSVQLVKYIRENATNEFLETRDLTSLARGRLRDVYFHTNVWQNCVVKSMTLVMKVRRRVLGARRKVMKAFNSTCF